MKTTSNKTAYQQDKINIAFDVEIPILIDNAVAALHYIRTEPPIVGHVPFCYIHQVIQQAKRTLDGADNHVNKKVLRCLK